MMPSPPPLNRRVPSHGSHPSSSSKVRCGHLGWGVNHGPFPESRRYYYLNFGRPIRRRWNDGVPSTLWNDVACDDGCCPMKVLARGHGNGPSPIDPSRRRLRWIWSDLDLGRGPWKDRAKPIPWRHGEVCGGCNSPDLHSRG